jgi:hypothetical protein
VIRPGELRNPEQGIEVENRAMTAPEKALPVGVMPEETDEDFRDRKRTGPKRRGRARRGDVRRKRASNG